jgi:hypothetical protein
MHKTEISITLLAVLLLSTFSATAILSETQAATDFSGIITTDTTWTKANGPYTLVGPVSVAKGVTLTIEPGAIVNLGDYSIQVNGTLFAVGTVEEPISFLGGQIGQIAFMSSSTSWNEHTGSGCIIENSLVTGNTEIAIENAAPRISNSSVNTVISINGGSPPVENNYFWSTQTGSGETFRESSLEVNDGSPKLSNNNFSRVPITINNGTPTISNNIMKGETRDNAEGVTRYLGTGIICNGGNPIISDNTIENQNTGIYARDGLIERNLITNST